MPTGRGDTLACPPPAAVSRSSSTTSDIDGGRQLDHAQATIDVLPEIVDAVAGRAEIVIDGGFTRGTDVVKAVSLGAKVVAIGRTALWGLAAEGAAGVNRTFQLLREEIMTALGLCGQTSIRGLKPDLIRRVED